MKNVIRGETDKDSSQYQTRVCWCNKKLRGWEKLHAKTVAWSYDMEGHAKKGAFKDVVNWQTKRQQQYKFSTLSQTLLATLRIQNRLQVEFCAFSEVEHSFSWRCKKQTSVSQSSTVSEIISLDAVLRMDVLPALDLWDVVIEVLCSSNSTRLPANPAAGNCSRNHKSKPKQKGNRDVDRLSHVDYVSTNANSSQGESQLYVFEDNEAVIKMITKDRSPK